MSDSDDTDVLLLIPPDLFLVPTSDSDDSDRLGYGASTTVVSELLGHVQSLENRVSIIESKDTSLNTSVLNNSVEASQLWHPGLASQTAKDTSGSIRHMFGSVSQISTLQNTPVKLGQASSVPTTPSNYQFSLPTNKNYHDDKSSPFANPSSRVNAYKSTNHTNSTAPEPDALKSCSAPSVLYRGSNLDNKFAGISHACAMSQVSRETRSATYLDANKIPKPSTQISFSLASADATLESLGKRSVREMELAEVDELLHEMESAEIETNRRNDGAVSRDDAVRPHARSENDVKPNDALARRLELGSRNTSNSRLSESKNPSTFSKVSLPFDEDSLHLEETDKMISDFKIWRQNCYRGVDNSERFDARPVFEELKKLARTHRDNGTDVERKIMKLDQLPAADDFDNLKLSDNERSRMGEQMMHSTRSEPPSIHPATVSRNSYSTSNLNGCPGDPHLIHNFSTTYRSIDVGTNTETSRYFDDSTVVNSLQDPLSLSLNCCRKPQRLLTLSDFWEADPNKSEEDMLRIKLEEEKFRREHCEHLIQELQKRLLEQQEKVAVAVRVDNEKNVVINRLQSSWTKLKVRWQALEAESRDLQSTLKSVKEKHEADIGELASQIKRCEGELSKALDLAAGYKEKSDALTAEKLELLKSHADELESYKSLVQEAEKRYSQLKSEFGKLSDQNQQLGEVLKSTQQEVNRERLRGGEVRGEMGVIHKALDACEAELVVLRQEKESLQLKLKEEVNRNGILEQNKASLLGAIDEARNAERMAKDEARLLASQQEKTRVELRQVYQKQVDDVVQTKLQEFQTQLDAAETVFQNELECRQRAIAECAARKIKSVLDKHQLEINLLEEKHKEEKRLAELQLAQAMQQISILDSKLNSQQANKTLLAEQLHCVMQKQWQQALKIISGGNMENLTPIQRIHAEKFFDAKHTFKSESSPNIGNKIVEPTRLESQSMPMIDVKHYPTNQVSQERDATSLLNVPPHETPLTSRKDQSKDDLRRYIKMILDMQQPKSSFATATCSENRESPPLTYREVPRKHYKKKEESFPSEESSVFWQPSSEVSVHEDAEYATIPQKLPAKVDQSKNKPPWK